MTKHTKGPWIVERDTLYGTDLGYTVPLMDLGGYDDNERYIDDCNLIAAAPDMYQALQDLVAACEKLGVTGGNLIAAHAALAKAND